MKKVLIVTKDLAEFNNYQGVIAELSKRHAIFIVAEGLSLEKWHQKRWFTGSGVWPPFIVGLPAEGSYDASTMIRFDINPLAALEALRPHLILTGLASPINLGDMFGLAANLNYFNIPLGFIEDLWGVHTRSTAKPNFVCTQDKYGVSLVEKYYGGTVQSFATGAPTDDALLSVEPHPEVEAIVEKTPYTVLVAGQDHATTSLLKGLIATLEEIGNYTIIPRFHPKWLAVTEETIAQENDQEKKKAAEGIFAACNQWRAMLDGVKNGNVWWASPHITTHQIMKSVPYTVSIYSNVLREAGILGSIPISWTSEVGRDMMRKHLGGLEQYPLVQHGLVVEVKTPLEWFRRVPMTVDRNHVRSLFKADGKNTERVVQVIERYL